jgi:hypothetical protein
MELRLSNMIAAKGGPFILDIIQIMLLTLCSNK